MTKLLSEFTIGESGKIAAVQGEGKTTLFNALTGATAHVGNCRA